MGDTSDSGQPTSDGGGPLAIVALVCLVVGFLGVMLFGWRGTERFIEPLSVPVDPTLGFLASLFLIGLAVAIAVIAGND